MKIMPSLLLVSCFLPACHVENSGGQGRDTNDTEKKSSATSPVAKSPEAEQVEADSAGLAEGFYLAAETCSDFPGIYGYQITGNVIRRVYLAITKAACENKAVKEAEVLGLEFQDEGKELNVFLNRQVKPIISDDKKSFEDRYENQRSGQIESTRYTFSFDRLEAEKQTFSRISNLKIAKGAGSIRTVDLDITLSGKAGIDYSMVIFCSTQGASSDVLTLAQPEINKSFHVRFALNGNAGVNLQVPATCTVRTRVDIPNGAEAYAVTIASSEEFLID